MPLAPAIFSLTLSFCKKLRHNFKKKKVPSTKSGNFFVLKFLCDTQKKDFLPGKKLDWIISDVDAGDGDGVVTA